MVIKIWNISDWKQKGISIEINGNTLLPGHSMNVLLDRHIQHLIDAKIITDNPTKYLKAKKRA